MPYQHYSVSEFVLDDSFQAYVLCTDPEAVAFWTNWLSRNPGKEAEIREAAELVRLLAGPKKLWPSPNKEAELRRLIEQLPANRSSLSPTGTHRWPQSLRWRTGTFAMAAAISLLLLAAGGWYLVDHLQRPDQTVLQTDFGQKRNFFLPDGTEVTLNANSTLRYQPDWPASEARRVWLDGEAFFRVGKRTIAGKPVKFTVQAGELDIEVLGTQFNVRSRSERTQVVLEEGKVRLRSTESSQPLLEMTPGEAVVYSPRNGVVSRQKTDPELFNSWRDNRLVFDNTPLSEVAEIIQQTYGRQITFADPDLMSRRLTGTIPSDDLGRLTKALSRAFDLHITERGDELLIESR